MTFYNNTNLCCAHLSLGQHKRFGQVHSLGVELQESGEVPALHGVVQPAGVHFLPAHHVLPLCILGQDVLLPGSPGLVEEVGFDETSGDPGESKYYFGRLKKHSHVTLGQRLDRVIRKARLHDVVEFGVADADGQLVGPHKDLTRRRQSEQRMFRERRITEKNINDSCI